MIKSMTGFGRAEAITESKKIVVEVRSLNSKQLDLSIRTPSIYRAFESQIRAEAVKGLGRGKVDITVSVEQGGIVGGVEIDRELFASYYRELSEIAKQNGMKVGSEELDAQIMSSVLRMPDVMTSRVVGEITEEESDKLIETLATALENHNQFRVAEGETLKGDILTRVELIEQGLKQIEPYESIRVEGVRQRIVEAIEGVGVTIDNNRLEQEMIYYVEKMDITEEKVRLANHCRYFKEVALEEQDTGRKLAFISQEMGREINTLGSKANNAEIQRIVVGMKDELEKIKEQLLNVL